MTAIVPIFLSSPYPVTRYINDYGTSSAVRDQTNTMSSQHREVMGALKDLAKGKIAVTVRAADVLPAIEVALGKLRGPAQDYDNAAGRWAERYARVRAWRRKREEAKEKRAKDDEAARMEAEAVEYQRKHSRWWRKVSIDTARDAVRQERLWMPDYGRLYSVSYEAGRSPDSFRSHPRKPSGYDDLPAIRELRTAASLHPEAVLSVPVEVITKLQRWAA